MSRRVRRRNDGVEHDRGGWACDRKFKPLILSEVQAAADTEEENRSIARVFRSLVETVLRLLSITDAGVGVTGKLIRGDSMSWRMLMRGPVLLKAAGRDVDISEFPNAPHDNPLGGVPAGAKDNQSVRNCKLREGDGGILVNAATEQPFAYSDACVALDPVVGADPEAREASRTAVGTFLKTLFKGN